MGESAGAEFAAAVSALKRRSGLSYGTLARQLHFSTSTLHRYCSGAALPTEYAPVERLARACGAGPGELVELHRLWLLADAERHRRPSRLPAAGTRGPQPGAVPPAPAAAESGEVAAGTGPTGAARVDAADEDRTGADEGRPVEDTRPPSDAAPRAWSAGEPAPGADESPARPTSRWRALGRLPVTVCLAAVLVSAVALVGFRPWQGAGATESDLPDTPGVPDVPAASAEPPATPDAPKEPPPPAAESESPDAEAADPSEEPPDSPDASAPVEAPLDWTVRSHVWRYGCGHPYLVDREPDAVPAPPVQQDSEQWANDLDAVHGGATVVETTLRPAGAEPVVVEAVHVRVEERADPLPWNLYLTGESCGGALAYAAYRVDLDTEQPQPVPVDGFDPATDEAVPPPRLPYQVTAEQPLSLRVEGETESCDCRWRVEVEWSSGRHRGTEVIDNAGQPFRTVAPGGGDAYVFSRDAWREKPE